MRKQARIQSPKVRVNLISMKFPLILTQNQPYRIASDTSPFLVQVVVRDGWKRRVE